VGRPGDRGPSRAQVIAATAGALALAPAQLRAQTRKKIRIAAFQSDAMTPAFYAYEHGLYEKGGLDVEMVATSSGSAATTAVVAGTYEMGQASAIASLLAHLRRLPVVVVANGVLWDPKLPINLAVVAADSPIRSAADLRGKTGGEPGLNDVIGLSISAWIDKNGGDSRALNWVEVPGSATTAALAQHRIDVSALNEPLLTASVSSGAVRVLAPAMSAVAERFAIPVYFANAEWAAKHPDAVKAFARITYEAAAYTNSHQAETAAMMSRVTKIPPDTFAKIARAPGATTSDPGLLQPLIDAAARYKNLPRLFAAREVYF
jgi:NitT/TauT family transport system substrate-binding protein